MAEASWQRGRGHDPAVSGVPTSLWGGEMLQNQATAEQGAGGFLVSHGWGRGASSAYVNLLDALWSVGSMVAHNLEMSW